MLFLASLFVILSKGIIPGHHWGQDYTAGWVLFYQTQEIATLVPKIVGYLKRVWNRQFFRKYYDPRSWSMMHRDTDLQNCKKPQWNHRSYYSSLLWGGHWRCCIPTPSLMCFCLGFQILPQIVIVLSYCSWLPKQTESLCFMKHETPFVSGKIQREKVIDNLKCCV